MPDSAVPQVPQQTSTWDPNTGTYGGSGAAAPEATPADQPQPTWNPTTNSYEGSEMPPPPGTKPAYGTDVHPPDVTSASARGWQLLSGALKQSNKLNKMLALAGAAPASAVYALVNGVSGQDAQDWYFKHVVDPLAHNDEILDRPTFSGGRPEQTDWAGKTVKGIGSTAMFVAQAIALSGAGGGGGGTANFVGGATAPAAADAIDRGKEVLEATGDAKAAMKVGLTRFGVNVVLAAAPGATGLRMAARVPIGAVAGGAAGEVQRLAENAALPSDLTPQQRREGARGPDMQQPFEPGDALSNVLQGAIFGLPGHARAPDRTAGPLVDQAREVHANIISQGSLDAMRAKAAQGGDALDQVVAGAEAGAVLGAHHDAAAFEMHHEVRLAQAAEEEARNQEMEDFNNREQALNAIEDLRKEYTEAAQPNAEEAHAQRAAQVQAQKDKDFSAAEGQREEQLGQERAATEEALNIGAQKGGLLEPRPTIEEGLPPEQAEALRGLMARRAAEAAQTPAEKRSAQREAAEQERTAQETAFTPLKEAPGEEALPEGGPPPQTPATLAERKQARLDAIRAAFQGVKQVAPQGEKTESTPPNSPPKAQFASATPEQLAAVTHEQEEHGDGRILHTYRIGTGEGGKGSAGTFSVYELPGLGVRRGLNMQVQPGLRGRGNGSAMLERAVQDAHAAGQRFESDSQVSAMQQGTYQNLRAKGYEVEQNPNADLIGNGELRAPGEPTTGESKGVFEVKPRKPGFADNGMTQDVARQLRMPKSEADAHLEAMDLPPEVARNITVHDNLVHEGGNVPDHIVQEARANNHLGARGVFDPATGQVHIFAPAHETGNITDFHDTVTHELMHQGLRATLGDTWGKTMDEVAAAAPQEGKRWMRDYAEQHGLDMRNPEHRKVIADEYGVHLSLNQTHNPTGWEQVANAVRYGMSKIGIGRYMSNDQIRDLVQRSNSGLSSIRSDIGEKERSSGLRWADSRSQEDDNIAPTDPGSIAARFGRTMEEQADNGPGYVRSRLSWLKHYAEKADVATMGGRLAFLHLDSLPDMISPQKMSTPRAFVRTVGQMEGRKGQLMDEGNTVALKWSRWANGGIFRDPTTGKMTTQKGNPEGDKNLRELMHASTLAGVDPSRPYEPLYEGETTPDQDAVERMRSQFHRNAQRAYNGLDSTGKELFNQVRDYYQNRRADVLRGLEARISETGADDSTKKQAMAQLRRVFEGGAVKGPYFPLARFGDMWASAKDPESGEYSFSRFEDPLQRKRWVANAKAAGLDIEQGTKMDNKSLMERVNPDFVKSVMAATEGHPELQDEIWQHYLKAMPEMSMRKQLIHRKGVLGYSEDALRAFAYNAFHSAHQIARLEYGNRLDTQVQAMKREADAVSTQYPDSSDAHWAPALAKEFERRLDWIKNPRSSSMASGLTKLGFLWYIGASPATAIRISTQNSMLAQPYLGSKWGQLNASRELTRAVGQWARAKGNLGDTLRGDERAAFDEARARGTFSSTSAQTLASGGADRPIGTGPLDAFNRVTSYLFNAMEHKNRMTTMLAAYRLGRGSGLEHDEATEQAIDASNKAHFNYANYNRPRVLQNDFMKVAGLFKQYPWQVTDRLARSFRDGVMRNPDLTPDQRNQQLQAFAGYMGKMMLFAGIKGVPILYHATMAAINNAFGDKDKPFDAQAALRAHLEDHLGKTASDAVMDGPMSALTGAALSNGASYADLWYKEPQRDENWHDQAADLIGQLAGPVYGAIPEVGRGLDIAHQGDLERGAEHFTPPMVNHLLKTYRLATQGVQNLRGEQVVTPEELGQGYSTPLVGNQVVRQKNLLLQALGFSPEVVARQYEANTSKQNFKATIEQRQHELTEQYDNAVLRGDNASAIKWMQQMQKFHAENPGLTWSARGIENGLRSRAKSEALAEHGVNMSPGQQYEYDQMIGRAK